MRRDLARVGEMEGTRPKPACTKVWKGEFIHLVHAPGFPKHTPQKITDISRNTKYLGELRKGSSWDQIHFYFLATTSLIISHLYCLVYVCLLWG